MCLILMLVSSLLYAIVAISVASMIYYYIQYKGAAKEWGDGLRGLSMQAARFSLLRLEEAPTHAKNWRPQVLVLTKLDNETMVPLEPELITLAGQLKGGKGLTLISAIIEGNAVQRNFDAQLGKTTIKKVMKDTQIDGFAEVIVGNNLKEAMSYLIQGAGLGALRHNTVLCGWPSTWREKDSAEVLVHVLQVSKARQLAVMLPKPSNRTTENMSSGSVTSMAPGVVPGSPLGVLTANSVSIPVPLSRDSKEETIDIWWILHDGGMLILIAFLLKQDRVWNKCRLRIFCVAESDDNSIQMEQDLALFLRLLRIDAHVQVVEMMNADITTSILNRAKQVEHDIASLTHTQVKEPSQASIRRMNTSVKVRFVASQSSVIYIHIPVCIVYVFPTAYIFFFISQLQLNAIMKERSGSANLVALNLPDFIKEQSPFEYMSLLEELTNGLPDVLFIRGGGREVITIFS